MRVSPISWCSGWPASSGGGWSSCDSRKRPSNREGRTMTAHEFALSDLAARLAGTDASLSTALRDILSTALQELIEAELTSVIGVASGEHSPDRLALRNAPRPKLGVDTGR